MGKVIPFGGVTRLDMPADKILEEAKGWVKDGVVIMSYDEDGNPSFASSMSDGGEILWLLEHLKFQLLHGGSDG